VGRTSDRRYPVVETAPPPFLPEGSAGILAEPLALDAEGLEALHSLCTALTSLRGHPGLLLALYDSPLLRDRLIAETAARLDGRLQVLDAREAPPDLLPWLVSVASPETDALFVVNLQNISVAAQYLNYRREILTQLPCPVVFWLPYDKEEELHRLAPDFWAFRRQTFVFRLFAPWVLRVSQKVAETGARAETPESRRASISLYRQLLSDLEHTGAGKTLLAARLRRQLGDLLRREGLWNESRSELEQALAILETSAEGDTWERAEALHSFGLTLYYLDELDRALASYAAALELFRAVGDRLGEANTLKAIGDVLRFRPDEYDQALAHYGQALELFRAVGDRLGEANVQQALGDLALREARLGEARKHYEAALAIYPAIGARLGEANVQQALGDLALREDRLGEARKHYEAALAIYPAIGARLGEANVQQALGDLALREDRLGEARKHYEAALAIYPAIGDRLGEANVQKALGDLALREARLGEARKHYEAALAIYPAIGDRLGEANVQQALGDLALREARLGEARKHYEAALAIYPAIGARLGEANTLASMSRLALREGREEEARALLQQAVDLHAAIGSRYDVAADLGNFGLALREMGRQEEARPYLLQAAEIFAQIGLSELAAQMLRAAGAEAVSLHPAVARMAPLLLALVAVAAGEIRGEAARPAREALAAMAQTQEWAALAGALQRVLDGEREWEALAQGLDEIDQQALALVLAALQDPQARQLLRGLAAGTVHE
jgi:tetratricopeptide (TPR) repeat protein